jgi:hypothetical protein
LEENCEIFIAMRDPIIEDVISCLITSLSRNWGEKQRRVMTYLARGFPGLVWLGMLNFLSHVIAHPLVILLGDKIAHGIDMHRERWRDIERMEI